MKIGETERLIIREFKMEDLDDLQTILGDPKVMEFSLKGAYSREETEKFLKGCLKRYDENGFGLYAVVHKEDGCLIGYCGFYIQQVDGETEYENGYRLAPPYWGKGLATEAAAFTLNYGLEELGFKKIISIIEPANIGSIKVAEKCGQKLMKETKLGEVPVLIYGIER